MFSKKSMSVIDWFLFFIVSSIPLINLIVWLAILFSKKSNPSLKSLLVAQLIIVLIFSALFIAALFGLGFNFDFSLPDIINDFI